MAALTTMACAHPHGAVDCRAELRYDGPRLQQMRGELWLDTWHSQRAVQLTHSSAGQPDAQLMQRFIFALKMQMGRANWLFSIQSDGQHVSIAPSADPVLDIAPDGRARIVINYQVVNPAAQPPAEPFGKSWSLLCADPSYYFVTAFGAQLPVAAPQGPVDEVDTTKLAEKLSQLPSVRQDTSAVKLVGCAVMRLGELDASLPAPRPGTARIDWVCQ